VVFKEGDNRKLVLASLFYAKSMLVIEYDEVKQETIFFPNWPLPPTKSILLI